MELSQGDLKVLLRILMENLGEAGDLEPTAQRQGAGVQLQAAGSSPTGLTDSYHIFLLIQLLSLS